MGDRIRQLEDALALLQASISKEPHPLLSENAIIVDVDIADKPHESEDEVTGEVSTALGTLSVSDQGLSRFFGSTGGSDLLLVCFPLGKFWSDFERSFSLTTKIRLDPLVKEPRVTVQRVLIFPLNFSVFPMLSHLRPWGPLRTSSRSSGAFCLHGNRLRRWQSPI
jgi:hypothetical protein